MNVKTCHVLSNKFRTENFMIAVYDLHFDTAGNQTATNSMLAIELMNNPVCWRV